MEGHHEGPVVGIDLGTTNSVVAVLEAGRPKIEAAIQSFEEAMSTRNPKEIGTAREQLSTLCAQFAGSYRW